MGFWTFFLKKYYEYQIAFLIIRLQYIEKEINALKEGLKHLEESVQDMCPDGVCDDLVISTRHKLNEREEEQKSVQAEINAYQSKLDKTRAH